MSRDYREKKVEGIIANMAIGPMPRISEVTVRMTSDERGQSLSLSAGNMLIGIPLEAVTDIIKVVER